ncbi:hypothetical protein Y032_0025g1221 [Ancylostoma ceylanicum]|nr:hypothetical protein Y032_0025g1221 [Ancylostoma ceylanicum]
MANVRLLSFSYTYSIVDTDDPVAEFPKEVEDSMNQIKLETAGAYVPTPVPAEDRNKPEDGTYQTQASIRGRFAMKTGQRGMKFSMGRTRGCPEAVNTCEWAATAMRLAPTLNHLDASASVARIQYKLPYT